MSVLMQYFERTIGGMERCFEQDKMVVLFLAVLLVLWIDSRHTLCEKENRLLVYSAGMTFVLLCPITAVLVLVYQSAFYDYEWAWNMVPLATVIAYGGVIMYDKVANRALRKKIFWWLGVVVLLFFCGNQGQIKTVATQEAKTRADAQEIAEILAEPMGDGRVILWAPKDIMQEVRRVSGEILLVYGKDMWDLKSGAFDYEAYSREFMQAYDWMETVTMLATETSGAGERELYEKYAVEEQLSTVLQTMLDSGVNGVVLPISTATNLDEKIIKEAEKLQKNVEKVNLEKYVVYLLK